MIGAAPVPFNVTVYVVVRLLAVPRAASGNEFATQRTVLFGSETMR